MFDKIDNKQDQQEKFIGSGAQLATAYVDGLTPLNFYKPLQERLRELNARFMSNDREDLNDGQ